MSDKLPSDHFMRALLNEVFWVGRDGIYSDKGDGPTKISELVNHASDCAHWVGEPCDCVTGKDAL